MNRNTLLKQLIAANELADKIREQINTLDRDKKIKSLSKFLGKCFIVTNKHHRDYVRCFYVYGIDSQSQKMNSLELSYWSKKSTYFNITYNEYFHPKDKDNMEKYKVISMNEFMKHYRIVQRKISNAITAKKKCCLTVPG